MRAGKDREAPSLLWEAFVALFVALLALTLALTVAALPIGVYTMFFTSVTQGLNGYSPISLFAWFGPVPVGIPGTFPAGGVLVGLLIVYGILLAYAARRGSVLQAIRGSLTGGPSRLLKSDLIVTMISIGFLAYTANAVDTVVQSAGIQIGGPTQSDFVVFVATTTSPLTEEVGFRLCFMGLVAFLLCLGLPWRRCLLALWKPSIAYEGTEDNGRRLIMGAVLVLSALAFGVAHVTSGSGWDLGKLPEAAYGGLVLGYVYLRFGLHTAILTHWGIDYLGTVYAYFGRGALGVPVDSTPGFVLQQVTTINFLGGFGLVSFLLVAYLAVGRLLASPPAALSS